MKLAVIGGGGFRVPLVYGALLADRGTPRVEHVALHDTSADRLATIEAVLAQQAVGHQDPPLVATTTDLEEALRDADFVFSAMRVGGLRGRTVDERVALDAGVLGQETTGPGGLAYGLRTVPVALDLAARVARICPDAQVINFANPAGLVTEAMQRVLGERVVGICDSPIALQRRAIRALGLAAAHVDGDYAGLNHLGWIRHLRYDGKDMLPELIADRSALAGIEEGRLFGPDWIADIGMLPNEYLYYYYFTREALHAISGAQTRGEFLLSQQDAFYAAARADRARAYRMWRVVREERDATYMVESRAEGEQRHALDVAGGGYEGVALAVMSAISRAEPSRLILNVRNGSTLPGLPPDAVVEVPCQVDGNGAHPLPIPPLTGHPLGLVQQVKAVEQLVIDAAVNHSARSALSAFALHPLVDSVSTARVLLRGYASALPELAELLR